MSKRRPHKPPPYTVVLVIDNLEYGGAQRQVVELANHIDPSRFDLHLCSLSAYVPLADRLTDRERRLHILEKKGKYDLTVVPRLAGLLSRLSADIVHGYLFAAEIASRLAGRWARTPLVFGSERNTDYRLNRRQRIAYRLTRRCMDLLIANSNAGAQFGCRVLGYAASQCRVVHNGVDTDRFLPGQDRALRRELGIGDAEQVVGLFASFKEQKNHALFFAAAGRVLERFPRTRFLLVGDTLYGGLYGSGDYKRKIERLVDRLKLRERCLFLGNRHDVERLYGLCELTVLPSHFEGTPNAALESMASGIPVVATRVSDNAEIIPDGQAGFLIPPGDEAALSERIGRLLADGAMRQRMGLQARRWVESEFSIARLAEKTARVYQESLAGSAETQAARSDPRR